MTTVDASLKSFLDLDDTKEKAKKMQELMEADQAVNAQMEKATSLEDLYEIFKNYISTTAENVKKLFNQVTDYFKEDKVALSDDTLDCVVGGWSFGDFFQKYKKAIIATAIVVGFAVVSAGFGAAIGGAIGAAVVSEGLGTVTGWALSGAALGAVSGAGLGYYGVVDYKQK